MSWTNSKKTEVEKRRSCRLLWKRLKVHWRLKKIRFEIFSLSLAKSDRRLTEEWLKRRRNSIQERTTAEP